MEVHHHSHSSHHGKKKWTHYFWEFLMLFLAVFCGFLAEYQLEHKIEKERVKKLMYDMGENLAYDTTRITRNKPNNIQLKNDLGSLRFEIKERLKGESNINRLYYFFLKSAEFGRVSFNRAAITQLKSSGLLRLVKKDSLVDEILDYYERKIPGSEYYESKVIDAMRSFSEQGAIVFKTTYFDFASEATDETWNQYIADQDAANLTSVLTMNDLGLLNNDPVELEKLHSFALKLEWSIINYNRFLNYAHASAKRLITIINKTY